MWSLIKLIFGAAMLGGLAYGTFFVELGGQTLAAHVTEVWRAPVVQQKVERLRAGVQIELHERLADEARARTAAVREREVSEADRQALEALLRESAAN